MRERLKNLSVHFKGNVHEIKQALNTGYHPPNYRVTCNYVCLGDKAYPKQLYDLEHPPFVLYYMGDINLLKLPMVSVIGSRRPSQYAIKSTEKLVEGLKRRYVIVSGLAKGIDQVAHKSSLDFSTVAVLGFGVDVVYPRENIDVFEIMRKSQCLISEYPPGTLPLKHHFPMRNRLIAALGSSLYVMSARKKSGTMHTVNAALELNRHIVCLPHRIDDLSGEGCNQLIQEGADILTSLDKV